MKNIFHTIYPLLLWGLILYPSSNFAQTPLKDLRSGVDYQFVKAQKLYNNGRIDSSLIILENTIESIKFKAASRNTKANVYRLAAHCCLIIEKPDKAQAYIKKMLSFQPNYNYDNINDDDLLRFKSAIDTLYALPRFTLGIKGGMNSSFVEAQKTFSVFELEQQYQPKTEYLNNYKGFQISLTSEYAFTKNVSLNFQPGFILNSFNAETTYPENYIESYSFTQRMNYFHVPLIARYRLFTRNIYKPPANFLSFIYRPTLMPYIQAGLSMNMLISADKKTAGLTVPVSNIMNMYQIGYIAGGGISFYGKNYRINLDLRYLFLSNLTQNKLRYLNDQQSDVYIYRFYDVMNDIAIHNFAVSLGFSYYISHKVFKQ